jgi:hypothetical protein
MEHYDYVCSPVCDRLFSCSVRNGQENMAQSSSTKAEWLGVLETAAQLSVEQSSAVWVWIMQELRLAAILSRDPRGRPAREMAHGEKPKDLYKRLLPSEKR